MYILGKIGGVSRLLSWPHHCTMQNSQRKRADCWVNSAPPKGLYRDGPRSYLRPPPQLAGLVAPWTTQQMRAASEQFAERGAAIPTDVMAHIGPA